MVLMPGLKQIMHLASIDWFHVFQETLKYTKEACNVKEMT